jgi:hypothetical protein
MGLGSHFAMHVLYQLSYTPTPQTGPQVTISP